MNFTFDLPSRTKYVHTEREKSETAVTAHGDCSLALAGTSATTY